MKNLYNKYLFKSWFLFLFLNVGCGPSAKDEAKEKIKLKHIPNFLSSAECDHLVALSQDHFVRSPVLSDNTTDTISPSRTSYTYFLGKSVDNIVRDIEKRATTYTGDSVQQLESLQVVRYLAGQQFKEHHDWFGPEFLAKSTSFQRRYTIFVYLNDVDVGGETYFPHLGLLVQPKKGDAVFWENCTKPDQCHDESQHAGRPPREGVKYGLNIWSQFDTK